MPVAWNPTESLGPQAFDNDKYYRVDMNGVHSLQVVKNVLWYRIGFDPLPGGMNLAGAEHLAELVYDQVWLGSMKDVMHSGYTLQNITVTPYNGFFDPIFNLPHVREVNEPGSQTWDTPGPASCFTARFNLEPQLFFVAGFAPPRRGYLALGPIREVDTSNDGRITTAAETYWETNIQVFANDLIGLPWPVTFFPCRMRITRLAGGVLRLEGYTDINGIDLRPIARYRRSRLPEA